MAKTGEQQQPVAGRQCGAAGALSGGHPHRCRGAGRERCRADRGGRLLLRIHCRIPWQADEEQAGGKGSKEEKESQETVEAFSNIDFSENTGESQEQLEYKGYKVIGIVKIPKINIEYPTSGVAPSGFLPSITYSLPSLLPTILSTPEVVSPKLTVK